MMKQIVTRLPALAGLCLLALSCGACSAPTASYDAACERQGIKPGTAGFADCLEQQDIARYGDRRRQLPSTYSAPSSF
jgi:hypothetical protein